MGVHGQRFGLWAWPLEASHYARPNAPLIIFYWLFSTHFFGLSTKFGHSITQPLDLDGHSVNRPLAYVKDERTNLNTLTTALQLVVKCKPLELDKPHPGNCFKHVMSKACQYGTKDIVLCARMRCVSLNNAQATLQIIITWTKKFGKGIINWYKVCVEVGFLAKIPVKTQFASKVVLFSI